MFSVRVKSNVLRQSLVWLLLGSVYWAQGNRNLSAQDLASGGASKVTGPTQAQPPEPPIVPLDTAVLTINGLCNNPTPNEAKPSDCKTVITRAEFEKMIASIQPNMRARARREFALTYANALVMARKAEQMGLDKGEMFEEQMKIARIEILSKELKKVLQDEASRVPDVDIETYYHGNIVSFEEAEMERIYVPQTQDKVASLDKSINDTDRQKQRGGPEPSMKEVAGRLQARAVAGEDFKKLQTEAYEIAGIKAAANTNLGKIRRISLPPDQVSVIDLKPGEVSSVVEALNGYFIYKMKNKDTISLEQAREEIRGILRSQRLQDETRKIEESVISNLNENYFRRPGVPAIVNRPQGKPDVQ